jgi:hypothetical protein
MPTQSNSDDLASDILRGAQAIADFVGLNLRDTWHRLERGFLPANKEGAIWVTTKTRLRKHYSEDRYTPPPRDGGDDATQPAPTRRRPGRPRGSTKRRQSAARRLGGGNA